MSKWEKLDDVSKNIAHEPWNLYWKEHKSGTKEFEAFLHNPKAVLVAELAEVKDTFNIQTNILNHERGLEASLVCTLVLVDPDKQLAYVTLYKH